MPEAPLAYFITFRCHGTWLPGDSRGFTNRGDGYDTPYNEPNRGLAGEARSRMRDAPILLDPAQRALTERTIAEACTFREWTLLAVNARTNHVHLVVTAPDKPERVMNVLKSRCTRMLREAALIAVATQPWSRHGSTVYLWDEQQVARACDYVVHGQDKDVAVGPQLDGP